MNAPDHHTPPASPGMSVVVQTVTRWVKSFIFLFGLYIVCFGHLTPGGGFSGGVILSCAFILMMLAFGRERGLRKLPLGRAGALDSIGALAFLTIAVLGLFIGGVFFANWLVVPAQEGLRRVCESIGVTPFHLLSAGTIPLYNLSIALKVSTSLFLVFAVLALLRVDHEGQED
jgi:multisubunit Na+/H+ antiporter MnhB subunit